METQLIHAMKQCRLAADRAAQAVDWAEQEKQRLAQIRLDTKRGAPRCLHALRVAKGIAPAAVLDEVAAVMDVDSEVVSSLLHTDQALPAS